MYKKVPSSNGYDKYPVFISEFLELSQYQRWSLPRQFLPETKRLWAFVLITGQRDKTGKAQHPQNARRLIRKSCMELSIREINPSIWKDIK